MNDIGTVNDQVVDSVNSVNTLLAGQSPAHAFAMLDTVMVETLGMAMYNAVNRQQNAGMVNSAAVTAACARMLNAYPPVPLPEPPPALPPPTIQPLPGPAPAPSSDVVVKTAFSQGGDAITTLQGAAASAGAVAQQANDDLQSLAKLAGATAPTDASPEAPAEKTAAPSAPGSPGTDPQAAPEKAAEDSTSHQS